MRPSRVWLVLAILYAAFFYWYTSLGGPLTPEEIDHYVGMMESRDQPPERVAMLRRFLEEDTGDDFVMVNVIELREPPAPVEGVPAGSTAQQMMDRYMEYMWPALLARASHPVLFGWAAAPAMEIVGLEGARDWTQAGMMRYRSRRDLMEIASNPEFGGRHEFKIAAISKTVAYPIDPWMNLGDPRLILALLFAVLGFAWQSFARDA
jgi:hypothetical protein